MGNSKVRVLPENTSGDVNNSNNDEQGRSRLIGNNSDEENIEGFSMAEYKYRLSVCRSKKPNLETIKEERVYSR